MKKKFILAIICVYLMNICFGAIAFAADNPDISQYATEILSLIEQCESRGLSVDYERNSYGVLELWTEYIEEDVASGETSRINQSYSDLTSIYEEAKANLNAYLSGTKTPLSVPKYVSGNFSSDDKTLLGYRKVNGKTFKSPMFLMGYGGTNAKNEIESIKSSGADAIQMEYGWENTVRTVDSVLNWGTTKIGNNESYIELVNEGSHSGNNCLKVVVTEFNEPQTNNYRAIHTNYAVKPNTTYEYGGWSNGKWFSCYGGGWDNKVSVNSTSTWTPFSGEFTTDSEATQSEFIIVVNSKAPDGLLLDDLYVREKGSDVNLLSNAGFEEQEIVDTQYGLSVVKNIPSIETFLQQAEDESVAVDFLIYSAKLHSSVLNKYPELDYSNNADFIKFDISSPISKRIAEIHISKLADVISKYNCVRTLCLMNEPNWKSNGITGLNDEWQAFLREKYTTIGALNDLYNSSFGDFSEISMPTETTQTPIYIDYREFNRQVMSDWHKTLTDYCNKEMPGLLVHSKLIQLARSYQVYQENGVDYEAISEMSGLAGCDGTSVPFNKKNGISAKTMYYEFLSDISNKPVIDSESHTLSEVYSYDSSVSNHIYTDMWQGAIHGRTSAIVWKWDRVPYTTSDPYRSVLYRPASINAIGKVNYDLNRLAKEVYKFINDDSDVALLYSDVNWVYDDLWMSNLHEAYYALVTSGCKPDFITEDTLSRAMDKKMIVVPGVKYISNEALDLLEQYIENNGILVFIGKDNIKYDIYGNEHDIQKVNAILNNSNSVVVGTSKSWNEEDPKISSSSISNIKNTIRGKLDNIGRRVKIVDALTGNALEDIEWTYSIDEYEVLVNICNYGSSDKNINIIFDGEILSTTEELISAQTNNTAAITAKTNTPLLIRHTLKEADPEVSNPDGSITVTNFDYTVNGNVATCILNYENRTIEDEIVNVEIDVYDDYDRKISSASMSKTIKGESDGKVKCTLFVGDSTYDIRYKLK